MNHLTESLLNKYRQLSLQDNLVFFTAVLINSGICYLLFGGMGAMFGVLTLFFSNIVYHAQEESNNIFYIGFLLTLILVGGAIGFYLKLSIPFYVVLFGFSYFYYVSYTKDPFVDRVVPFIVIFACMGTTLPSVSLELPLAFLVGTVFSLIILTILKHKKFDSKAFRKGLFSKKMYQSDKRLSLRAFIYSLFLFLSLAIPDYFDLYRVYWAPLTFVVLLRPLELNVIKTTLFRFAGSLLGAILILVLFKLLLLKNIYTDLCLIAVVIFFMPTFLQQNYLLKTFAITVFVLLLIEEGEFWSDPTYLLPVSRVYETFIGGMMAIFASFVLKRVREE